MPWPLSQDYNEAIQTPAISFEDADLRAGEPVLNAMSLPMPRSGNFADVYEFRSPQGQWAIKCFTREIPNLRERYRLISKYLQQVKLPFFVDFEFLDRGIRVRGQWYPILKMQWVEGQLLNEFLRNNLDRPASWEGLIPMWLRMAQRLHEVGIAHGDLQHGNIILVPGRKADSLALKLIDYDGLYVPDVESIPCGEVGHANYQHPHRIRDRVYNERVDRLPLLAIYTALHCLSIGGRTLWDRFDNGDNLLFRSSDLADPVQSPVFKLLWTLPDRDTHNFVGYLIFSLLGAIDDVPRLNQLHQGQSVLSLRPAQVDWLQTQFSPPPSLIASRRPGEMIPVAKLADPIPPQSSASFPSQATVSTAEIPLVASPRKPVRSSARLVFGLTGITTLALVIGLFFGLNWFEFETNGEKGDASPKTVLASQKKNTPPGVVEPQAPSTVITKESNKVVLEREIRNSIGMKLVYIPPGTFTMGSPKDEHDRDDDEDQHEVYITKGFYLGKYEVMQEEYKRIMGSNRSRAKGEKLPVEMVTWHEAKNFCRKLSAKEGQEYRLPSEAEWEYACRAGTTMPFHFGLSLDLGQARFKDLIKGQTVVAGSYRANLWGLHHMHGNVREWCEDWYAADYYKSSPLRDPLGPSTGSERVFRGGSFYDDPRYGRSANRGRLMPAHLNFYQGFRVALHSDKAFIVGLPIEMPPPRAYLADIKESSATFAADQAFYKGTLPNGKDQALKWFVLDGKEYAKGIFAHPPTDGYSAVKYDLDGNFSKFSGIVGIRDGSKPWSPQQFIILGDDRVLWQSIDLPGKQRSQSFDVVVSAVRKLELRTVCKGVMHTAHACWFDPYLLREAIPAKNKVAK
jgi:formylglycine-generating enzyme required for sulfatase activity